VRWIITGLTVKQCSTVLIFVFAMKAEITNKYSCEHPSYSWIKNWTVYEDRTMHSSDNPINITRPHAWECVCMHMSVEPSSFSIFILIIRQTLLCLQQLSVKNKQSWLQNLSFNYRTLLYKIFHRTRQELAFRVRLLPQSKPTHATEIPQHCFNLRFLLINIMWSGDHVSSHSLQHKTFRITCYMIRASSEHWWISHSLRSINRTLKRLARS